MSEALYYWDMGGLAILIPKRRGVGFLKQPCGHHFIAEISDIESSENVDVCGLDGNLTLEYGYKNFEERPEIVKRVLPKVAAYFKFKTWREASKKEFFKHLIPE